MDTLSREKATNVGNKVPDTLGTCYVPNGCVGFANAQAHTSLRDKEAEVPASPLSKLFIILEKSFDIIH